MKIALSGASSTGKTTVCQCMGGRLPYIGSSSRRIAKKLGIQPECLDNQIDILNFHREVIKHKIEEESKYSNFITDRSILDSMAYTYKLFYHLDDSSIDVLDELMDIAITHTLAYDYIFRMPIEVFDIEQDQIRKCSYISNRVVDLLIDGILTKYKINNVIYIPTSIVKKGPEHVANYIFELVVSSK